MKATLSKNEIESALARRFGTFIPPREHVLVETLSTGIREVDLLSKGLPRGAVTEVFGQRSSGRTSLMLAALSGATAREEVCALIDTSDRLDLVSARGANTEFERLLWIRCRNDVERAFRATDLVLQSGGFGLVVLDMADVSAQFARRIVSTWWYRFRRAIENTPAAFVVISQTPCVGSCASLSLELKKPNAEWSEWSDRKQLALGTRTNRTELVKRQPRLFLVSDLTQQSHTVLTHAHLLCGSDVLVARRKPIASEEREFQTHAVIARS